MRHAYPKRNGDLIRSDGSVVNQADGLKDDGIQMVEILNRNEIAVVDYKSKRPLPPTVSNVEIYNDDDRYIKYMDKDGHLYATKDLFVQKSVDFGETWETLGEIPNQTQLTTMGLVVADNGRVIVGDIIGRVYTSDLNQQNFTENFQFESGRFVSQMAQCVYQNIIILSSYGDHNADNPPRHVYLSDDFGKTFRVIYEGVPKNKATHHIHDCQYDPYEKRLWLAIGDHENTQLLYSDDFGKNWNAVFGDRANDEQNRQITQIMPFEHGIIFGTDAFPDGLTYYPKRKNRLISDVNREDFIIGYYDFGVGPHLRHFATRQWRMESEKEQIYLMPFYRQYEHERAWSRLLGSADGITWYELYRHPDGEQRGFQSIMGPHPEDPERRIFGMFRTNDGDKVFKARLPVFI